MEYRRNMQPGGTFFFTLVTWNRIALFNHPTAYSLISQAIHYVMDRHPFTMIAYIYLPDHLHLIWELPEEDGDFPLRIRLFKSHVSRNLENRPIVENVSRIQKREQQVWRRRYWEHTCRDQGDLNAHIDYIHYNPVKHGLVTSPHMWGQSSFMDYIKDGVYELDWSAGDDDIGGRAVEGYAG